MTWQDYYEIAQSLRARSDWLFAQGEHQYASAGVWGALRYASRALKARYGGADGNRSLEKGYLPGQANGRDEVNARKSRWASAELLHRHFYNSNLPADRLAVNRNEATELLGEAFGAPDARGPYRASAGIMALL